MHDRRDNGDAQHAEFSNALMTKWKQPGQPNNLDGVNLYTQQKILLILC